MWMLQRFGRKKIFFSTEALSKKQGETVNIGSLLRRMINDIYLSEEIWFFHFQLLKSKNDPHLSLSLLVNIRIWKKKLKI